MGEYEKAEEYIENITRFTEKHDLSYIRGIMDRLGLDEEKFSLIHAAGTNGKGSVCIYTESMLLAAGKSVGTFTSPHLITIRERVRINGTDISEADFLAAYRAVYEVIHDFTEEGNPHPSFFEFLFFVAMKAFDQSGVEFLILETGLGGRLDTTNVIRKPLVTAITSISLDHTFFLGDTITAVAGEKAGILKPGVPIVYLDAPKDAEAVIHARAIELGCPEYLVREEDTRILRNDGRHIDFTTRNAAGEENSYRIATGADYQPGNAAEALRILDVLEAEGALGPEALSAETRAKGLAAARWPGRLEEVRPGVYVDGGHNPDGIRSLLRSVKALEDNHHIGSKKSLLFAVSDDKDYMEMIDLLTEAVDWRRVIVTSYSSTRSLPAEQLAALFAGRVKGEVISEPDAVLAYEKAARLKDTDETLFILGSLYLAGMIIKRIKEEDHD